MDKKERNVKYGKSRVTLSARYIAWKVLTALERSCFSLHADEKLHEACDEVEMENRDRRLTYTLVSGALSNRLLMEQYITRYSSRPLESIDPDLRWLFILSFYQLVLLDRITDYAAVNEAVAISKSAGKPEWAGFINGILRAFLRDEPNRPRLPQSDLPLEIRYSHPAWLVERWTAAFGEKTTEAILTWNNQQPEQYARVRCDTKKIVGELGEELVQAAPEFGTDVVRILRTSEVIKSKTFKEGKLYLMQPWSTIVAHQLPLEDSWKVLDMCAAPGGKSIALADRAAIHITAADVSEARLPRMKENFARCRVTDKITVTVLDGCKSEKEFGPHSFNAVLVDAPCSNLGVIQRNPEVRWRISLENIRELAQLQIKLLENALKIVKPGGFVLYAICTISPEETDQVVNTILKTVPGINCIGSSINMPGEGNMDGGYRSLIQKVQENE